MADLIGSSLRDAKAIELGSSRFQAGDQLAAGEIHSFKFNLGRNRSFLANLKGLGTDMALILDRNGNNQVDAGEVFASSRTPQEKADWLKLHAIPQGTYFLQIFTADGKPARYRLAMGQRRFKGDNPEMEAFLETNDIREQNGLDPLALNTQLSKAAFKHSKNMALLDFFSHTGMDGSQSWDRIQAAGYDYSMAAENIAIGYETGKEVLAGWMGSESHRVNVLDPDLTEIGFGYFYLESDFGNINYNHYWSQTFGKPANG
jgi:hypothetical protein